MHHRRGTILLIVAGLAGLLASLAIAFLARVGNDLGDMAASMREIQARIMLTAACGYIQEASRIGWEPRQKQGKEEVVEHLEAHGWIDVRDGSMGPRLNSLEWGSPGEARSAFRNMESTGRIRPLRGDGQPPPLFPVNIPQRFPMYMVQRPPFAIQAKVGYNPISTKSGDPERFIPYLRYPDPQPAVDNGYDQANDPLGAEVHARKWDAWATGDPAPRNESLGMSWFRILREETGSVFTVTCGAGGTWGFRDWKEVQRAGETDKFDDNPKMFDLLSAGETRFWYRLEWSAAVTVPDHIVYFEHNTKANVLQAINCNLNASSYGGTLMAPNMGGTIQWIQRLRSPPAIW